MKSIRRLRPRAASSESAVFAGLLAFILFALAALANADDSAETALGQALVANKWSWARSDGQGGTWRTTLTFHQDGTVSNPTDHRTWYWWVIDDQTAHVQFHREPGSPPTPDLKAGMNLSFDADLTKYRGVYLPDPKKPIASGERKEPTGEAIAETKTPVAPADDTAGQRNNPAKDLYEALVGHTWSWTSVGAPKPPIVVSFAPDGHVSGGWTWQMAYKPDGQAFVDCSWGDHGHQYLAFDPSFETFEAYDTAGHCVIKGQRLDPIDRSPVAAAPQEVSAPKPTPSTPAAHRAAQVYDALLGYHWAWIKVDNKSLPLAVDFTWDGHVSGGWTWQIVYKPDGETLVDCDWGGNGHQYLRMNSACDAFDAFDANGNFKIKGKRLDPIDQPVNQADLAALQPAAAPAVPANGAPPSRQIEPLLEPCLNAILAPLAENPQMPRVPVEKLRATLGAGAVRAKSPLQKQIYQYAMAVCEALTNGMDERAQARAMASASGQVPSLSAGAGIVKTMPLRGWDAGANAEAIRKQEKDERNYLDKQAKSFSNFTDTAASKAWVARAAGLRENVMGLYGKLVQLEAAEPTNEAGAAAPPTAK